MTRCALICCVALLFVLVDAPEVSAGAPAPLRLTCEYRVNPLGIDDGMPRFSWQYPSTERNHLQSAYELVVSDDRRTLPSSQPNMWTTGKVTSSKNIHIPYEGKPLKSFTRYYWQVRTYDQQGAASDWSEVQYFETAMLRPDDWQAKWIGDGRPQFTRDEDFYQDDRMPLFQRPFTPSKKVSEARLYISGMGYYEAYLNGKKIGDNVLDPGWTTFSKQVLYVVHDVTPLIKGGANTAGIMLGNGWWNPLPMRLFRRFNLRDYQQTGRPCVKAELHLRYADGTTERIVTDRSWSTAPGPVIRNNVYLGEHYDARLEQPGFYDGRLVKGWTNAVEVAGPSGKLSVQMQPPVRVTKTIKPVRITEPSPGVFIADMGQNFAGVARIKVKGKAGTRIKMRYGEALHEDGSLNFLTTVAGQIKEIWNLSGGPGAPKTAWQEDNYILKGKGLETWSPRFTFHGFRFVEVTGWPGKLTVDDIEGLRMNADLETTGTFSCSNELFNRIQEVTMWTFLSNVFSVQSDCPGREKMGYGADLVVSANAFIFNFDMANFYRKAVTDFANDQQPDGGITEISPYTGIADRGYGGHSGPLGWQLAFPFLQKQLYDYYGDKRIIEAHYDGIVKQLDFLENHATNGLFHWDISDHIAIDPKPEAFSAACFYYHHVQLASAFAGILKKESDSVEFARRAERIKQAIVRKYLVPNTGRFDNATQSAQLFALWYGLSPEEEKSFAVLKSEFDRHNRHVSSGIFGNKMMYDYLLERNENELAFEIANQRDYPSLGYMLEKGATTLWESWEYPANGPSQNHPMLGSVSEWFFRGLLGINPAAPGFERIRIKPQPAGDLTWAKGKYHSVKGEIVSEWKIEGKQFVLNVSVPGNTTAEVWLPAKENTTVTESGKAVGSTTYRDGYAIVEVGSGSYRFTSQRE